jgi:pimeloyl-ACP methyl ester carboxylesterase
MLLIHGAFSSAADFSAWRSFFAGEGFDVVAPSLPAHAPSDPAALATLSLPDYLKALLAVRNGLAEALVVVGHSMGGLLAQQLAAATPCRALVCVASAPPGKLPAQVRSLPHLAPLMPAIMAGRPIRPSPATFRALALHDLPTSEQQTVSEGLGYESGRAYRAMILGLGQCRVDRAAVRCPVLCLSGGLDRIISRRLARSIAARYRAEHKVFPARGHWLIAPSAVQEAAGTTLQWLRQIGVGRAAAV